MPSRLDKNRLKIKSRRKAIWLFAGGSMQKLVAQKILDRGYKLILTDKNPKCRCRKYADKFIDLDTFDINGNLKQLNKLKGAYDIKAVLTVAADCHETVSVIAKELNLPGIDPKISHICRYKLKTRELLTRIGLPQPLFRKVIDFPSAKKIIKELGLPVVIKSSNNSGSRGFYKIKKLADLNNKVFFDSYNNGTAGYVIVEKMLLPVDDEISEQSVETLWNNGKMYWLNWVDRLFRKNLKLFKSFRGTYVANVGWGVELAHINPAIHDIEIKNKVRDAVYKAGISIGMHRVKGSHVLKADIMLTKQGPYILELTPRLSGGWDSPMTTPLRGADFIGGVIELALGEKLTLDLWSRFFEYQNPNLFASVFALVKPGARDSIDRKFAAGTSFDREESLKNAYERLRDKKYIT